MQKNKMTNGKKKNLLESRVVRYGSVIGLCLAAASLLGGPAIQKGLDEREAIKQEHLTKIYRPRIMNYKAVKGDSPWRVCSQHNGEENINEALKIYFLLNDGQRVMYAGKTYSIPCYDAHPQEGK